MTKSFETVFSVPMECKSCVDSVSQSLRSLGVEDYKIDLAREIVTVTGSAPPSLIVKAIQSTGKDAIIRGTGKPNSAAVCILESFDSNDIDSPVKGLARIVSAGESDIYVDLTLNGLPKGRYYPQIRKSGDLSIGALSTGAIFHAFAPIEVDQPSTLTSVVNSLGAFSKTNDTYYSAQSFLHANLKVQDLIGRSMVLSHSENSVSEDSLCGVIARSAGAWENNKEVCSCTGKTVWQEREDALKKGITS